MILIIRGNPERHWLKNTGIETHFSGYKCCNFLTDRKPFSLDAARLFEFSLSGEVGIYISPVSYNNIYFILRQSLSELVTMKLLNELAEILDVTKAVIQQALRSEFKDFEDAIQYNCAVSLSKIECIVTRNSKDFKKSFLAVMTPGETAALFSHYA